MATSPFATAAIPIKVSGAITGTVSTASGIPQMGANVILLNRQERPLARMHTNYRGEFAFAGLFPDIYSIRVTLATFYPAVKKDILVQPGMRSMLNVNLSTLFSTIQLSYPSALESGSIMSDEWKWVLRSASATRPVLRFLDGKTGGAGMGSERSAVFSDTRGVVRLSAGEGAFMSGVSNEADLGTTFAVATSVYGNNLLQVSGNLGYGSQTGVPSAAFRTSYSRNTGLGSPEVSLTMRQLFLPARIGAGLMGNEGSVPMLRSMSASFDDHARVADNVNFQYGFTMDSVSFVDRLNYFSPYARLTYTMGDGGEVSFSYTSGNARPDLAGKHPSQDSDLQHDLNTLAMFPRISLRDSRPHVQRGEEYEIVYSRKVGSRTFAASAYRESVTNAALSVVAPGGMFTGGDILPDLFTGNSVFNVGNHENSGYTMAVTQDLGDHVSATIIYGSIGGLTADSRELMTDSPDELRSMIHAGRKHAATARVSATAPHAGTHMIASYQWNDQRYAMSGNLYSTQTFRPLPGLNIYVRQPIPKVSMLPWRMEATADLRNMLAQGYLPIMTAGGQQILLVETPRSFRGGLSFIF